MCVFFFFKDTATTEIYTLSLHDALPIFGKTEVALRAAAAAALAGKQVAVVAPTTVLVRQHVKTFERRFAGLGIRVAHLSRLVPPAEAREVKKGLADGAIGRASCRERV